VKNEINNFNTKYCSRAGDKLQHAINTFKINIKDKICADLGCSTGGFVDCMLKAGAKKIYAVDTAYGVLDWKLRNDPRVVVMERTNALHVHFPEKIDFISIDAGWTRQKLIVPKALELLNPDGDIISLLKPHYETNKNFLTKGKLETRFLEETINLVTTELEELGINIIKMTESPILGKKGGNPEYLLWIKPNKLK
jgi:23S rRNA (cytidine1920-2'-O)/16S rRNA (cytidine1409-2'-O)-methyltransferase